jgi:hypothetical protein
MKSERRHELQYNMLDQKLSALLAWTKKNANHISWGVLLIVAVVAIGVLWHNSSQNKLSARGNEYDQAVKNTDPDMRLNSLIKISQEEGDRLITVEATQQVGDEYSKRITAGQGKASVDDLKKLNDSAAGYYQRVIDNFKDYPAFESKAHYGMAKLAENRRDFDQAAKEYQLARSACPQGSPLMEDITSGSNNLPTLRLQTVKFATTAPAKPVTTEPASGPATKPATFPASAPATVPAAKPGK